MTEDRNPRPGVPPAAELDGFLDGALTLAQPAGGYRAAIDSVLLGAAVRVPPGGRAIEFGCGAGAALLVAAHHGREASFTGIEIDPALAALTRENVIRNGMADRVEILCADAADLPPALSDAFDTVLFNPPFFEAGDGAQAPTDAARARAFVGPAGLLEAWIAAAWRALRGRGRLVLIHRADAWVSAAAALAPRWGEITLTPIQPTAGAPANRILVTARKAAKGPARIAAPIVLHGEGGGFTPEVEAVLRGRGQGRLEG